MNSMPVSITNKLRKMCKIRLSLMFRLDNVLKR